LGFHQPLAIHEHLDTELPEATEAAGLLRPPDDPALFERRRHLVGVPRRELAEMNGPDVRWHLWESWHHDSLVAFP
jgi:hypothetical protein